MAAPDPEDAFEGQLLPGETVRALMVMNPEDHVGGNRIARFTPAARDAILPHLPDGAEYAHDADTETFRWTVDGVEHEVWVTLDEDRIDAAGLEWTADTPANVLTDYVIVFGGRPPINPNPAADEATLVQAINLALQDVAPVDDPNVIDVSGGRKRRKGKKTRKTKGGKKRKTLRRRK